MFSDAVLAERPWSDSKLKLLDKCPLAYCLRYRDKLKGGKSGDAARIGTTLHAVFEYALRMGMPDEAKVLDGQELGDPMEVPVPSHTAEHLDERLPYLLHVFAGSPRNELSDAELTEARTLLPRVKSFVLGMQDLAERRGIAAFFLEHKTAIGVDLGLRSFDDPTALIRGVVDFGFIMDNIYVVIDHKTGKPQDLAKYADQLRLYTLFGVAEHPEVEGVQCGINHVRKPKVDWQEPLTRQKIQNVVAPWLGHNLNRVEAKLTYINQGVRTARPGPLCSWCDYVDGEGLCPDGLAEVTARPKGPRKSLPVLP